MYAPLTSFRPITLLLILLSMGVNAALMILGGYDPIPLWVNWAVAGVLSAGIWQIVAHFSLDGGAKVRAFAISWPLLSLTMNFSYCNFAHTDVFLHNIAQLVAMLAILSLIMSLWQLRQAIVTHMVIGLIIGLVSTLMPHTVLWMLLLPIASYFMRSWSTRNIFSSITGMVLGIWVIYCILAFVSGFGRADQMLSQYAVIARNDNPDTLLLGLGLWQYLYLGFSALLLLGYSASARVINTGTVRAGSSILLIAMLSFMLIVLLLLDLRHLTTYLSMFSLFLGLQLTIHQANHHSAINEWWTLCILLIFTALSILPLVVTL